MVSYWEHHFLGLDLTVNLRRGTCGVWSVARGYGLRTTYSALALASSHCPTVQIMNALLVMTTPHLTPIFRFLSLRGLGTRYVRPRDINTFPPVHS